MYLQLPFILCKKLAAVPVLSNYLLGMAKANQTVENEVVQELITMLWDMVDTTCDIAVANNTK